MPPAKNLDRRKILYLWEQGVSLTVIARTMGCGIPAVQYHLDKVGLTAEVRGGKRGDRWHGKRRGHGFLLPEEAFGPVGKAIDWYRAEIVNVAQSLLDSFGPVHSASRDLACDFITRALRYAAANLEMDEQDLRTGGRSAGAVEEV